MRKQLKMCNGKETFVCVRIINWPLCIATEQRSLDVEILGCGTTDETLKALVVRPYKSSASIIMKSGNIYFYYQMTGKRFDASQSFIM